MLDDNPFLEVHPGRGRPRSSASTPPMRAPPATTTTAKPGLLAASNDGTTSHHDRGRQRRPAMRRTPSPTGTATAAPRPSPTTANGAATRRPRAATTWATTTRSTPPTWRAATSRCSPGCTARRCRCACRGGPAALRFLIESLNDDGYLEDTLEALAAGLAPMTTSSSRRNWCTASRWRCGLLQSLDPPGVGARAGRVPDAAAAHAAAGRDADDEVRRPPSRLQAADRPAGAARRQAPGAAVRRAASCR
jgi:RNA polymerase sigma-54 factor